MSKILEQLEKRFKIVYCGVSNSMHHEYQYLVLGASGRVVIRADIPKEKADQLVKDRIETILIKKVIASIKLVEIKNNEV